MAQGEMMAKSFNQNYTNQDLIQAVQNGTYDDVCRGRWNDLRVTRPDLDGVSTPPKVQLSFACRGIKRYEQQNLVMIGYDMSSQNDINWNQARIKFERFLARKLHIDRSSIEIQGIVSGYETWYVMRDVPTLIEALNQFETLQWDWKDVAHTTGAVVVGVGFISLVVLAIIKK